MKYRKKFLFFNRSDKEIEAKVAAKRDDILETCENRAALISPRYK